MSCRLPWCCDVCSHNQAFGSRLSQFILLDRHFYMTYFQLKLANMTSAMKTKMFSMVSQGYIFHFSMPFVFQMDPKSSTKATQGYPRDPKVAPSICQEAPMQGTHKRPPGSLGDPPGRPPESSTDTRETPRRPKDPQGPPRTPKGLPRDRNTTKKTPKIISGNKVIVFVS